MLSLRSVIHHFNFVLFWTSILLSFGKLGWEIYCTLGMSVNVIQILESMWKYRREDYENFGIDADAYQVTVSFDKGR